MGLVLVFDLDQTIIDSSDPYLFNRPNTPDGIRELRFRAKQLLNFKLLNSVIKRAARLRGKKDPSGNDLISGIFLLTNNSSKIMVSAVDSVLRDEIALTNPEGAIGRYMTRENFDPDTEGMPKQDYFFDSILMREHRLRTPGPEQHSPVKLLKDVTNMLGFIGGKLPDEELRRNIFFFDDMDHPGMTLGDNYIKIVPPFNRNTTDQTSYTPVLQRLSELDGQPMEPPRLTKAQRPAQKPLSVSRSVGTPLTLTTPVERQPPFGRPRSGAMNNRNINMKLPPPAQEVTVRHTPNARRSLSSLFTTPISSSGGYKPSRIRRTRKNGRNKSRKRLRK